MTPEDSGWTQNRLSRRGMLRGITVGAAGLAGAALIGCGDDDSSDDEPSGGSSSGSSSSSSSSSSGGSTATEEPMTGGDLVVGVNNDLNPQGVPFRLQASTTGMVVAHVFGTLLRYEDVGGTLAAVPHMAETFELATDAMSATATLHEGITFHDGRPFTAEDVKWNLSKATDPDQRSQVGQIAEGIEIFEVVDDRTINFTFNRPMANFADLLVITGMADPDTFDQIAEGKFNGTGPFTLGEWRVKESVRLDRFDGYFTTPANVDSVTFLQFQDNQAMGIALESGDVHYIQEQVSPEDFERWDAGGDIQAIAVIERGSGWYFGLNTKIPPLDDVRVRKAMNLAMNRQRFLDEVLLVGRVMTTPWPTYSQAFNEEIDSQITYDLDAAKALLAEAGYPEGIPDAIPTNLLPTRLPQVRMGEIWQADLEKIGIKLDFRQTEYSVMIDMLSSGGFDGVWVGFGFGFAQYNPATTVQTAFPLRYPNTSNHDDPEWIDAVEAIKNAAGTPEELQGVYDRYTQAFVDGHFVLAFSPRTALSAASGNVEVNLNYAGSALFEGFSFT